MRLTILLLIYSLIVIAPSYSQPDDNKRHVEQTLIVLPNTFYTIKSDISFTALSIAYMDQNLINSYVFTNNDTFKISLDEHYISETTVHSQLISFPKVFNNLGFYSGNLEGQLSFHFINGSLNKELSPINRDKVQNAGCEQPVTIPQSIWRSGLNDPNYQRITTPTNHVIVHHSAGSNSNTNYTQVVRDIYIYHTQVNKWSDIGYNYLIAANGDIYNGRDPDQFAQDEVQGAHFCGDNSNTMGICMMGTYTAIQPSKLALNSLIELVTWKMYKDDLDPLDFMSKGSIGQLGVLAGHRDGCATECPGKQTYAILDSIRIAIHDEIESCMGLGGEVVAGFSADQRYIDEEESIRFLDESKGAVKYWKWYFEGGSPSSSSKQNPDPITYYKSGFYDVQLIVASNTSADTLLIQEYVTVVKKKLKVLVYPNPVRRQYPATIKNLSLTDINKIAVYGISGQLIFETATYEEEPELDFSGLRAGVYILQVKSKTSNEYVKFTII